MKTLALIVRKPGLSRDAFREHYEQRHAPLALPMMSGLVRYVRHHVREELYGAAGFDAMTAFAYRDRAALDGVIARLALPAGDAVLRDELTFMDKPRNRFFAVREAGENGSRARTASQCFVTLVKRAPGQGGSAFAAAFAAHALPALLAALPGSPWSLHHEALASFGEPPYDAVVQLHADAGSGAGLAAWCAARERAGERVALVRVSEHETPLPEGGVP